jgi:hypothetical protein
MASPNARSGREVAKTGPKMVMHIQARKNIMVGRQPNRSCVQPLMKRPTSWPTTEELDRPDCQDASRVSGTCTFATIGLDNTFGSPGMA